MIVIVLEWIKSVRARIRLLLLFFFHWKFVLKMACHWINLNCGMLNATQTIKTVFIMEFSKWIVRYTLEDGIVFRVFGGVVDDDGFFSFSFSLWLAPFLLFCWLIFLFLYTLTHILYRKSDWSGEWRDRFLWKQRFIFILGAEFSNPKCFLNTIRTHQIGMN